MPGPVTRSMSRNNPEININALGITSVKRKSRIKFKTPPELQTPPTNTCTEDKNPPININALGITNVEIKSEIGVNTPLKLQTPTNTCTEDVNPHIIINVLGFNNVNMKYQIGVKTPLNKLAVSHCLVHGLQMSKTRFIYDGVSIGYHETPSSMEMEDGDTIEVFREQLGHMHSAIFKDTDDKGKKHEGEVLKIPNIKRKKYSNTTTIDREQLIKLKIEYNEIQREISQLMKDRNLIEGKMVEIKEKKLAALIEKNECQKFKIDTLNNVSNIMLNVMSSRQNI